MLRGQTEHSRLGVTVLRQGSSSTNLDNGGSDFEQRVGDIGMLIQTGRDTNGVGESVAEDLRISASVSRINNVTE